MNKKILYIILGFLGLGILWFWQNSKTDNVAQPKTVTKSETNVQGVEQQKESVVPETKNDAQVLTLTGGKAIIATTELDGNKARFYKTTLSNGKIINFFVVKDKNGIYRVAANACQVCFSTKEGFRQEGNEMVCNTCGNRYPLEKIATEKGGCNPAPINPNLKVINDQITILESELAQVGEYF